MNQQNPPRPRPLTKEQIAIVSRHAAERAELDAHQHNERVAMGERQEAEFSAALRAPTAGGVVGAEVPGS